MGTGEFLILENKVYPQAMIIIIIKIFNWLSYCEQTDNMKCSSPNQHFMFIIWTSKFFLSLPIAIFHSMPITVKHVNFNHLNKINPKAIHMRYGCNERNISNSSLAPLLYQHHQLQPQHNLRNTSSHDLSPSLCSLLL